MEIEKPSGKAAVLQQMFQKAETDCSYQALMNIIKVAKKVFLD